MATEHPVFRAQEFKVDPRRFRLPRGHGGDIARRRIAGKRLDHDIGRPDLRKRFAPPPHFDSPAVLRVPAGDYLWTDLGEAREVVDPQADPQAVFGR